MSHIKISPVVSSFLESVLGAGLEQKGNQEYIYRSSAYVSVSVDG